MNINQETSTPLLHHVYTLLPSVVIHIHHQNASLLLHPSNQCSHISPTCPIAALHSTSFLFYERDAQSIIIRSLMLNSLVVINGGQVPGRRGQYGLQTLSRPALSIPAQPRQAQVVFLLSWLWHFICAA